MDENQLFESIELNQYEVLETFFQNPPLVFDFFKKKIKESREITFLESMVLKIIHYSLHEEQINIKKWENIVLSLCKIVNERELQPIFFLSDWSLYKYTSEIKKKEYLNEDFCIEILQSNYFKNNVFYVEKIMIEAIRMNMNRFCELLFQRFPQYLHKDISNENKKMSLLNIALFSKNRWARDYLFEDLKKNIDVIDQDIIIQNFIYSCNIYFYFKKYSLFILNHLLKIKIFILPQINKSLLMVLIENSMEQEAIQLLDYECYEEYSVIDFVSPKPALFGMKFGFKKDAFFLACEKNSIQIIKKLIWKLPLTKFILIRNDFQENNWGELNLLTFENRPKILNFIKIKEDFMKEYYGIHTFLPILMNKIYSYVSYQTS